MYPAIVILVFSRVESLGRPLASLSNAIHSERGVPLVFSIDGRGSDVVLQAAHDFVWEHLKAMCLVVG